MAAPEPSLWATPTTSDQATRNGRPGLVARPFRFGTKLQLRFDVVAVDPSATLDYPQSSIPPWEI
jgi:hypothetical protein